jgi:hypothetical protein
MLSDGRHQVMESAPGHQVWADSAMMNLEPSELLGLVWRGQFQVRT